MWKIWCKALGKKEGKSDKEADKVAIVRTLIFFTYLLTNIFIVSGVIRHWNDVPGKVNPIGDGTCLENS
jgi:hypothetical protein